MRTFYRLVCLVAAVQFAFMPGFVFGGTLIQEPRHGYTLTLPEGWERIPGKAIEKMTANLAAASGGKMSEHYDDGFQQSADGKWFQYPYIMVQVKETGRIPEAKLAEMKSLRQGLQKGADEGEKKLSSLLSNMSLGDTFYDASNKCILINFTMNAAGVGELKTLTCGFLTQKGMLLFHCCTLAPDFERQLPIFQSILDGVRISEELRYKSSFSDNLAFNAGRLVGKLALVGGLIGAVVGLIIWLLKKKTPTRPPPLP